MSFAGITLVWVRGEVEVGSVVEERGVKSSMVWREEVGKRMGFGIYIYGWRGGWSDVSQG